MRRGRNGRKNHRRRAAPRPRQKSGIQTMHALRHAPIHGRGQQLRAPLASRSQHLTQRSIQVNALLKKLAYPSCGGTAVFWGTVRNRNHGRPVRDIRYEAAEPVAEPVLREIHAQMTKMADGPCILVHRIGRLRVGEISVFVAAASAHRAQAFAAARHGIEAVKARVPIWKEEFYADGSREWLDGCALEARPHSDALYVEMEEERGGGGFGLCRDPRP